MRKMFWSLAVALVLGPLTSVAQPYPSRPVKIVNPYAAGGPVDIIARELATGLSTALNKDAGITMDQ